MYMQANTACKLRKYIDIAYMLAVSGCEIIDRIFYFICSGRADCNCNWSDYLLCELCSAF